MKEQCMICGSMVEDVSGICPVCGAVLGRSTQVNPYAGSSGIHPKGGSGYGQPGNQYGNSGYGQPGNQYGNSGYGQPIQPNANAGYGQVPYNYQDPGAIAGNQPKKKKLLSILSIVMAALSLLTICLPVVSIIFAIAAIVLGIIALVKKQIKVPAVLGLVFSGIGLLLAVIILIMNFMMYIACGTNTMGILEQSMEILVEGSQSLEDIMFTIPDNGDYHYVLYSDGSYMMFFDSPRDTDSIIVSGSYKNYSYADDSVRDLIGNEVLAAMREGYRMKNVTCVVFEPHFAYEFNADGYVVESNKVPASSSLVFVVPDNYHKGDMFYRIEAGDDFDQELTAIYPSYVEKDSDILPEGIDEELLD